MTVKPAAESVDHPAMAQAQNLDPVLVAVADLTDRQLLLHVLQLQTDTNNRITSLEATMAELSAAVAELQGAVDGVAQRLLPKVEQLEAALAAAQADDADAAALLEEATQATAEIRAQVEELNSLGADPSTPVEPAPEEPGDGTIPEEPGTEPGEEPGEEPGGDV